MLGGVGSGGQSCSYLIILAPNPYSYLTLTLTSTPTLNLVHKGHHALDHLGLLLGVRVSFIGLRLVKIGVADDEMIWMLKLQ